MEFRIEKDIELAGSIDLFLESSFGFEIKGKDEFSTFILLSTLWRVFDSPMPLNSASFYLHILSSLLDFLSSP